MKIIQEINQRIYGIIGFQRFDPKLDYIESQYIIKEKCNDTEQAWLNTFTKEMLIIKIGEILDVEYLVKHWWLFEKTIDQYQYAKFVYRQCIRDKNYNENKPRNSSYVILSTTACNANCWYCYEKQQEIRHMSKETALDVAKFIKNNYTDHVQLSWFGGEPLVNRQPIDIICNYLYENDIIFNSDLTTNGYLLDTISDYDLLYRWRLDHLQISLDGYGDEYNKIKQYNDYNETNTNQISPYDKILKSIRRLLDLDIKVSIRCNVSYNNKDSIVELINDIDRTFGRTSNLNVYAHELFEVQYTDKQMTQMFENLKYLYKLLFEKGYLPSIRSGKEMHTHCMADNGDSYIITPTGKLSICEHYVNDTSKAIVGSIYENKLDTSIENSWSYYKEDQELCKQCKNYPYCLKLANCPACIDCTQTIADCLTSVLSLHLLKKLDEVKKK